MKALLLLALSLYVAGCAVFCKCRCPESSAPLPPNAVSQPRSSVDSLVSALTFTDTASRIVLRLPPVPGWETQIPDTPNVTKVAFIAMHLGKLVNLALSIEPLNSDPQDYFILVNEANQFASRPGYAAVSKDTLRLHGRPVVKYVYRADIELPPADTLADTLPRIRPYVFTNIFYKHRAHSVWLEMNTLGEAYDRKTAFIDSIVNGLDTLP
ncbi:MAG: hypothetical protein V1913_03730 [Fibrobacterota bacterium]